MSKARSQRPSFFHPSSHFARPWDQHRLVLAHAAKYQHLGCQTPTAQPAQPAQQITRRRHVTVSSGPICSRPSLHVNEPGRSCVTLSGEGPITTASSASPVAHGTLTLCGPTAHTPSSGASLRGTLCCRIVLDSAPRNLGETRLSCLARTSEHDAEGHPSTEASCHQCHCRRLNT